MTISKALRKFEELEVAILRDGKVDWAETEVLLDFIRPYVIDRNKRFLDFERLLTKCRKDGKIDENESGLIVSAMTRIKKFLKVEKTIEIAFVSVVGIIISIALATLIL